MTRNILAVDDSPSVRKLVEFTLKRGGFLVTTAQDGQEALEIIVRERFDAVILDVNMPRLDGFEFLKRIKANESLSGIPVVMLTTEGHDMDKEQASKLGATGYLVKPFKPTALLELMNEVLTG
jgi:two-component system, chemotaxis family, chemotaxis protein CheY